MHLKYKKIILIVRGFLQFKTFVMKTIFTQQEILLITNSQFAAREWAEKKEEDKNNFTRDEKLEEACWNGLLTEMLPEIMQTSWQGKNLSLWKVQRCNSFLQIELSDSHPLFEMHTSIDPYFFVPSLLLN